MTIRRMDHVGIVVDDIADAVAFFTELGLELEGETSVAGDWVDRVIGFEGVRAQIVMLRTPDGRVGLELSRFDAPSSERDSEYPPANAPGIRHISFLVEDVEAVLARLQSRGAALVGELVRYRDSYTLCYVRGPSGIIVELAEELA
jgi:catechol 2,3-dioxygenase-like lactoylglutathione lyase family enzyme